MVKLRENISMIDLKSQAVLKILIKECKSGGYKLIEQDDVISAMPERYKVDRDGLKNILTYLEHSDCISIKYDDDGVFCLCVLPYGYKLAENKSEQKKKGPAFPLKLYVLIFIISFVASFLGAALAKLISI